MSSWAQIQKEIEKEGSFDVVRRKKYKNLVKVTGRPLLIYATAFLQPAKYHGSKYFSIDLSDIDGFSEITKHVEADKVDILIHSPGGSAEATESLVKIVRSKFKEVRVIVTGIAKSAATMFALSADEIIMSPSAELGPIDPQVRVRDRFSPVGSIIEQFELAEEELRNNPASLPAWIPILQEFAPSLMVECRNYLDLSKKLVISWMQEYMFKDKKKANANKIAKSIAEFLTDEKNSLSHARRVDLNDMEKLGAKVKVTTDLGDKFAEAVDNVHQILMMTLNFSDAIKIFENSEGQALLININVSPNSNNDTTK